MERKKVIQQIIALEILLDIAIQERELMLAKTLNYSLGKLYSKLNGR